MSSATATHMQNQLADHGLSSPSLIDPAQITPGPNGPSSRRHEPEVQTPRETWPQTAWHRRNRELHHHPGEAPERHRVSHSAVRHRHANPCRVAARLRQSGRKSTQSRFGEGLNASGQATRRNGQDAAGVAARVVATREVAERRPVGLTNVAESALTSVRDKARRSSPIRTKCGEQSPSKPPDPPIASSQWMCVMAAALR